MFNARNLVLLAFLAWSVLCWRWYVCIIKDRCLETGMESTAEAENTSNEATEAAQPIPEDYTPPPPSNISTSESDLEKVQVYEGANLLVIHFPYNSTQKEADNAVESYLKRLADQAGASGKKIVINGHTDFVGDEQSNFDVAQKRAESIKALLVAKGVPDAQITCRSYGETRPTATNDTPEGRYQNRRVEIVVAD